MWVVKVLMAAWLEKASRETVWKGEAGLSRWAGNPESRGSRRADVEWVSGETLGTRESWTQEHTQINRTRKHTEGNLEECNSSSWVLEWPRELLPPKMADQSGGEWKESRGSYPGALMSWLQRGEEGKWESGESVNHTHATHTLWDTQERRGHKDDRKHRETQMHHQMQSKVWEHNSLIYSHIKQAHTSVNVFFIIAKWHG